MVKNKFFGWHSFAVSALFVLGDGIISLPQKNADEFTITAFIIIALVSVVLYFLASIFVRLIYNETKKSTAKKIVSVIGLITISVFSVFCATSVFKEFINFVSLVILVKTPVFYITVLFLFVVVYFFLKRQENILKFSLVSLILVLTVLLFFFFASADKYNVRNIYIFRLPTFKEFFFQIRPYISKVLSPVLILPFYFLFAIGAPVSKQSISGVGFGLAFLGLSILMSVLLFGPQFAGKLDFPFSSAVSIVTVGRLFTRLDGFSYFIYFVCSLIKISVCLFVCEKSFKIIGKTVKSTEL